MKNDILGIHTVNIRRCIDISGKDGSKKYELITFTDASKYAYGAVTYLKISDGESNDVNVIFAKTRLAPIKTNLTIHRLELMAVLIGCRISQNITS